MSTPLFDAEMEQDKLLEVDEAQTNVRSESWLSHYTTKTQTKTLAPSKVFQGKSAIGEANIFSRFMFSWTSSMLSVANRELLHVEMFGNLRQKDEIQVKMPDFEKHYARYLE